MNPDLEARVRNFAGERQLKPAMLARWLASADADAAALIDLAVGLRLGENQLRDLWNWADDIAVRDDTTLAAVFGDDRIAAVIAAPLGRNERLSRLRDLLRRRRYPDLVRAEAEVAAHLSQAGLPASIRARVPEFLDGEAIEFVIRASSYDVLAGAARAVLEPAAALGLRAAFDRLQGRDRKG